MAHDVFISYASEDKPVADAMCATLESSGIRCWIAPRDVLPGKSYAEAIIDGITESRVLVLVLSSKSNGSPYVMREVERAVNKAIPIVPFRTEDVALSRALEYFVSSQHWLDALTPPLKAHLKRLAETLQVLLCAATTVHEPEVRHTSTKPEHVKPQITARAEDDPPFEVDAIAIEDDTYMVLSASPDFEPCFESLERAKRNAAKAKAVEPGCVVVRGGHPLRLLAIIHDLSQEPTWTENSVQQALLEVFFQAEDRKLKAIAVPPLGTKHGSLEHDRFIELFNEALAGTAFRHLRKVWFVVPEGFSPTALKKLAMSEVRSVPISHGRKRSRKPTA